MSTMEISFSPQLSEPPGRALKRVGADVDVGREKERKNVGIPFFCVCISGSLVEKAPVEPSF